MGTGEREVLRRESGVRRRRKLDGDDDDDEEYVVDEEEEEEVVASSDDEEFEEDEELELEMETPRPKRPAKGRVDGGRGWKDKPPTAAARSRQRRHEEDEDYEEEDEEFDPDVDEEEELEDEEEEFGVIRAKKVSVNNQVKRKSAVKRRGRKKKSGTSKVSRQKVAPAKVRKAAPMRRQRKRSVIDDFEEDEFIVDDLVEVNRHSRKRAKVGRKMGAGPQVLVVEADMWPSAESDTSDFDFVTSDEELGEKDPVVTEPVSIKARKGRRKWIFDSESSSDSEFVISDEDLRDVGVFGSSEAVQLLPVPPRTFVSRKGEEKGKEKRVLDEAGKPTCGICLSEEQRANVQGMLNCCSHYFCFACIMEWSKVESRCPLCKKRFTTVTKSSKVDLGLGLRKAVIRVEERDQVYQPTEEEMRRWFDPYENVVCIECNQGGDDNLMLLCDICDSSAHTYCVGLGRQVPEGNWYCGGCRSGGEGPSYTEIQNTVAYQGESNISPVGGSSEGFGTTAPSVTFQRPPPICTQPTLEGIDLNLSPREIPKEPVSTGGVSTLSGRHVTLSGRREIHQHIRILLSRPRSTIRPYVSHGIQQNGGVPGTEQNHGNFHASTQMSSSQTVPDVIQNQHSSFPFGRSNSNFDTYMSLDGSNFQQIEGVKSNLKRMCTHNPH